MPISAQPLPVCGYPFAPPRWDHGQWTGIAPARWLAPIAMTEEAG